MPDRAPSNVTAAYRRLSKRARTSSGFSLRIALTAYLSVVLLCACRAPAAAVANAGVEVGNLLSRYQDAIADPGVRDFERLETSGTVAAGGLTGTFRTWLDADRERSDQSLGPRSERTLRIGERMWYADASGNVREFTGVFARRARTQRFIDSGSFAQAPGRCVARGPTVAGGKKVHALDVTADGGETETLYLDAVTGLPDRVGYDDDDGRTTIDYSDWRTIAGRRFAFKLVVSNGDRAFDIVQTTTSVDAGSPVDAAVFAPLVGRRIETAGLQTVRLTYHDGHFYAPVRIDGRPFTFLLDTGSQDIVVDKRVAAELGLSPVGAFQASGAARTGGLRYVQLAEIAIAGARLRDVVVTTLDLRATTSGAFRIDGILGYPFFASASVRLDPAHKTMTFGTPGAFTPEGDKVALVMDRAIPEATLRLDATTNGQFIVDTGNAAELLLYKPFVDKHPGIVPFTQNIRRGYGIGGATNSYRSSLESLDIGGVSIYHTDVDVMRATRGAFADRFAAGNVGLGILKNFVVTFDEANSAMYLQKGDDFNDGRARV